ncbi:nucleoside diphosphate kinase regulator [Sphingomonas sp. LaA6.9]|uniref:nucleoside diphosphate kinase regulator n=1 Tax=Sphingomonas sp. LaA6.9 TaxID=2919914 RepID=UPI001F4F344A|nr:nucleoside diphosphate kinase regulator [Sphingomonas sp. LaA6.9]MCJ8157994.1 nucleoside diphosphate kinase regulator [Sphingomonas sp. LaA6.9]
MRHIASGDAPLPTIVVSEADQDRLYDLAYAIQRTAPEVAKVLLQEMGRAEIRETDAISHSVIAMGSLVRFRDEDGQERTITLVYPGEADIEAGRISVATPVGAALIGLSVGQSFRWTGRDGQDHVLTVLGVAAGA